eukprot:4128963-Prymnesium_polylepis.1
MMHKSAAQATGPNCLGIRHWRSRDSLAKVAAAKIALGTSRHRPEDQCYSQPSKAMLAPNPSPACQMAAWLARSPCRAQRGGANCSARTNASHSLELMRPPAAKQ